MNKRADFEKFCVENGLSVKITNRASIMTYQSEMTEIAWQAWKTAYELGVDKGYQDNMVGF